MGDASLLRGKLSLQSVLAAYVFREQVDVLRLAFCWEHVHGEVWNITPLPTVWIQRPLHMAPSAFYDVSMGASNVIMKPIVSFTP